MYEFLWQAFITMLIIVDPFIIAPVFFMLSHHDHSEQKIKNAKKSCLIATILLLLFAMVGDKFLNFMGISESAFRIAGGFLLLMAAIEMVLAKNIGLRSPNGPETKEAILKDDISVFPLAIPLIAGPGSMTSTVVLMNQAAKIGYIAQVGLIGIIILVILLTYITMRYSTKIMTTLGVTGANVLTRVFGIILSALAIQNIIHGLMSAFKGIVQA